MTKSSKILCTGLVLILGLSIGLNFHFRYKLKHIPSETFIDTIRVFVPVPKDSVVLRYVTVTLPTTPQKSDTTSNPTEPAAPRVEEISDSADVVVPITQKVYEGENYKAWVSGFMPSLDSLEIREVNNVIHQSTPLIEWSVGLQLGMTWVPSDGIEPYVGIGVQLGIPLRKFKKR